MPSLSRKLASARKRRGIRKDPTRKRLTLEFLEDRRMMAGNLDYQAVASTPLTLRLASDDLQVVDSNNPSIVLASELLSDITGGVHIEGNSFDVNLTIDVTVPPVPGGIVFDGGSGTNTLLGPNDDTTWHITGPGSGDLDGTSVVSFSSVENLVGGEATDTLDYSGLTGLGVTVDSSADPETATHFTSISSFENVIGTDLNDTITGSSAENILTGGPGDDALQGGESNDTYIFADGWGTDTVTEQSDEGEDALDFGAVTVDLTFAVSAPGAVVVSDNNSNTVDADNMELLFGGSGINSIDYSGYSSGVTVDLAKFEAEGGFAIDRFVNVTGSDYNDTITGDDDDNILTGGAGSDTLSGGIGDDTYVFGTDWGGDTVTDVDGFDTFDFSLVDAHLKFIIDDRGKLSVEDWSNLSFANGTLEGTTGLNSVVLGDATSIEFLIGTSAAGYTNTLDYSAYTEGVEVDLSKDFATLFAGISHFDHVIGTSFSDLIAGDDSANILIAGMRMMKPVLTPSLYVGTLTLLYQTQRFRSAVI